MKTIDALSGLILEIANLGDVQNSIKKRKVITIYYDGDEPGGKGYREIEPVCIGYSKAGNLVLRAWDLTGASHTKTIGTQILPGWRMFRLDKIFTYQDTNTTFDVPRPGFNPNGDKSMTKVILNAEFNTETDE